MTEDVCSLPAERSGEREREEEDKLVQNKRFCCEDIQVHSSFPSIEHCYRRAESRVTQQTSPSRLAREGER